MAIHSLLVSIKSKAFPTAMQARTVMRQYGGLDGPCKSSSTDAKEVTKRREKRETLQVCTLRPLDKLRLQALYFFVFFTFWMILNPPNLGRTVVLNLNSHTIQFIIKNSRDLLQILMFT